MYLHMYILQNQLTLMLHCSETWSSNLVTSCKGHDSAVQYVIFIKLLIYFSKKLQNLILLVILRDS